MPGGTSSRGTIGVIRFCSCMTAEPSNFERAVLFLTNAVVGSGGSIDGFWWRSTGWVLPPTLRRGEPWAFWLLVVGSLIGIPYYLIIAATYAAQGAPISGLLAFLPFWAIPVAGFVVGSIGLWRAGSVLPRAAG